MDSIQLKKTSGSSARSFSVLLFPFYVTEDERYSTIDFEKKRIVHAKYRAWKIVFGMLTTSDQDYLNEISYEEEPQFIYDSSTYNIEITEQDIKAFKGSMTIVERTGF